MKKINLFLVRHGETDLNKNKVYFGQINISINNNGILQCLEVKEKLKDYNINYFISSNLNRCIETVDILNQNRNICVLKYDKFNEFNFGDWEGKNYKQLEKHDKINYQNWCKDYINFTVPNGESFKIFYDRVIEKIEFVLNEFNNKNICLVLHNGTLKVIISHLLNLGYNGFWNFRFEHGKISLIEKKDKNILVKFINK